MNVCMITPMLPPDQAAVSIFPKILGNYLLAHNHKVRYITFYPRDSKIKIKSINIKYITAYFRKYSFLNKFKVANSLTILSFILNSKKIIQFADVIHIHSYSPLTYGGILLTKILKKPVLITLYGTEIWSYKPKKKFDLFKYIMNKLADYVVFYSKGMMEYANKYSINPKNQTYIHPPIKKNFRVLNDYEKLKQKLGFTAKNNLINVKDLYPVGGHKYLIKAIAIVCKEFPDTLLFICGGGYLKERYEKLAEKLNIKDKIKFTGIINNDDLVNYYNAADLFVLSSVLESFGAVIVEALACGTKVVATNTVGAVELNKFFPDMVFLAENKNPQSIAEQIIIQLQNKQKINLHKTKRVQQIFSVENVAEKYLQIYKKLVS